MLTIFSIVYITLLLIVLLGMIMMGSITIGLIFTRGVPFVSTPRQKMETIFTVAQIMPGQVFFDLGCGKGEFLIEASNKYGARAIGYEISLWPYLWAKAKIKISGSIAIVKPRNFFKADLSPADVIYCYLWRSTMAQLEKKICRRAKAGEPSTFIRFSSA